jgi:hypothetical protein
MRNATVIKTITVEAIIKATVPNAFTDSRLCVAFQDNVPFVYNRKTRKIVKGATVSLTSR